MLEYAVLKLFYANSRTQFFPPMYLSKHGLASAGRSVHEHIAIHSSILLGVDGGPGQRAKTIFKLGLQILGEDNKR